MNWFSTRFVCTYQCTYEWPVKNLSASLFVRLLFFINKQKADSPKMDLRWSNYMFIWIGYWSFALFIGCFKVSFSGKTVCLELTTWEQMHHMFSRWYFRNISLLNYIDIFYFHNSTALFTTTIHICVAYSSTALNGLLCI